ncbi:uncharacterized protein J3R85_003617 [Psidium guajava]|nr:uncharacterized protein J3R85_003617 [Psidium guajava]
MASGARRGHERDKRMQCKAKEPSPGCFFSLSQVVCIFPSPTNMFLIWTGVKQLVLDELHEPSCRADHA